MLNSRSQLPQEVEVDSGGSFSYTYNTKSIPPGIFEVEVGALQNRSN